MEQDHEIASRICVMRETGASVGQIVSSLGVSWDVVVRIVRKTETEAIIAARSRQLLHKLRCADDLDKKWKGRHLVQAIGPITKTQNALVTHFECAAKNEISLRDIMDLTISARDHPKTRWVLTPILDLRCVGLNGFWSMVARMTESDLGAHCNQEWWNRLARLKQASRIVGGGHLSWSKACKVPKWFASLSRG